MALLIALGYVRKYLLKCVRKKEGVINSKK